MSRSTISTFQLFALFPDEETARLYLEDRLWPNGPICPDCKSGERVSTLGTCATRKPGYYRCLACAFDFTIRTNTIFERSKVPLHKWLYSMYLLVTARKGISSLQLAKEIGVTQKTAWFILGRLREACGGPAGPLDKLRGIIEIDEAFFGGKEANKHESKKLHAGRGPVGKTAVLGMRERGGRTRAKVQRAAELSEESHDTLKQARCMCAVSRSTTGASSGSTRQDGRRGARVSTETEVESREEKTPKGDKEEESASR